MSTLSDDLRELGRLKRIHTILGRRHKEYGKLVALKERDCFDRMESEGFEPNGDSTKLHGRSYAPKRTTFAIIQNRDDLIEWLRENDEGVIEKERLREGELNRIARERLDNGQELPPGMGYYDKEWIATRGITARDNQQEDA